MAEQPLIDEAPPAELLKPAFNQSPRILGPGTQAQPPIGTLPSPEHLIRPNGPLLPARPFGLAKGETSFFGIRDTGTHFVYVLDASASMGGNSIRAAKSELIASLEALEATQQFQVIFYNTSPRELTLRGAEKASLYWATSIIKTLARQEVGSVGTAGGTDHMPALELALKLKPDVIFFLTDADDPLRPGQRDKLKRRNNGRARIHCIQFGQDAELRGTTNDFLRQLAHENGGTYRYHDAKKF